MHQHIKIYNQVPYNTAKDKLEILTPCSDDPFQALAKVFGTKSGLEVGDLNAVTAKIHIPAGHVSDKMNDEPYIVPFLAEGSDRCVIVCAGGAYLDVSLDNEGYPTCQFLQEHGISAFALKYRVWPYQYPCALLDLTRAIKYVRYHADDFGIDPGKISIMGFSAGGNLVGTKALMFKNLPEIENYIPDEIDKVSDAVATVAPVYPELLADRFLMALQYGEKVLNDDEFAKEICQKNELTKYVSKDSAPMFLCACRDDAVVNPINVLKMAEAYLTAGAKFEVHLFSEGGHGFGVTQENIPPMYGHNGFNMAGTKEWIRLYIEWLNKTI